LKSIRAPRRYPCGKRKSRLEQIADAEQATRDAAILTVLAQPHRRGNRSQLAENPLGRFCLAHGLDRALYYAAEAYGNLRQKWRAYSGAPLPDRLGGSGGDVEFEQWQDWLKTQKEWERDMERAGGYIGRLGVISLIFDRPEPTVRIEANKVIDALKALAKAQGWRLPDKTSK
jgi:hypothetical protein